jgi:hypothetical protein
MTWLARFGSRPDPGFAFRRPYRVRQPIFPVPCFGESGATSFAFSGS